MNNIDNFLHDSSEPRVVFFSGAGLSAESGIRTFRDCDDGLWEEFDITEVCLASTFHDNYDKVHEFYNMRRKELSTVQPNDAHFFIAEMQKLYGDRCLHFTANVDDLCERAGGQATHIHGNLLEVVQDMYGKQEVLNVGYEDFIPVPGVPSKPNIAFFEDTHRYENGEQVQLYSSMHKVLSSLGHKDTAIVIGSGDEVVRWSMYLGFGNPVFSVNVNPQIQENDYRFSSTIYQPATKAIVQLKALLDMRM